MYYDDDAHRRGSRAILPPLRKTLTTCVLPPSLGNRGIKRRRRITSCEITRPYPPFALFHSDLVMLLRTTARLPRLFRAATPCIEGSANGVSGCRAFSGLTKEHYVSTALSNVIGTNVSTRGQITKGIWDYIKSNDLQQPHDRRMIRCDHNLQQVFDGNTEIHMLSIGKLVQPHILEPVGGQ